MTGLLELADRCEAATGPDRELDKAICSQVWQLSNGQYLLDAVTGNIDTTLKLLPPGFDHYGFDRNLAGDILSPSHVTTQAFVDGGASDFSQYHRAEAATPALALCAAALRARARHTPESKQ